MSRKQLLREQFEKEYGKSPESILGDDYDPSERDLELALRLRKSPATEIALIIQAENLIDELDEAHLSDGSIEDVESMKTKLRFNKKVVMAKYGMQWSRIRDLFIAGDYETLEENYSEDFDAEDLAKWETEEYRDNASKGDASDSN